MGALAMSKTSKRWTPPTAEPHCSPMYKPGPDDWNWGSSPKGQSFSQWSQSYRTSPRERCVVYLQPLGDFEPLLSPSFDHLAAYARAYFTPLQVRVLPPIESSSPHFQQLTTRQNEDPDEHPCGGFQILTRSVFRLLKARLP